MLRSLSTSRRGYLALGAAVLALVLIIGGIAAERSTNKQQLAAKTGRPRDGTLRARVQYIDALTHFARLPPGYDYLLDPQWTYEPIHWKLFRCCLLRTLLSYNGHPTAQGGAELHPDLAAAMPEISQDRLAWTFRLKHGLHYAPPFADTEIRSPDIVRALERDLTPSPRRVAKEIGSHLGSYRTYYVGVIAGGKRARLRVHVRVGSRLPCA